MKRPFAYYGRYANGEEAIVRSLPRDPEFEDMLSGVVPLYDHPANPPLPDAERVERAAKAIRGCTQGHTLTTDEAEEMARAALASLSDKGKAT